MPTRSQSRNVDVGVADVIVFGPNPQRKALIFSAPTVGRYTVAFGEVAVLDAGPTVHVATNPLILTRDHIGDDIVQPVHLIGSAAAEAAVTQMSGA